jgi:phosphate/sulfate permease
VLVVLGSRVLETVSNGITELYVIRAVFEEFVVVAIITYATLVVVGGGGSANPWSA